MAANFRALAYPVLLFLLLVAATSVAAVDDCPQQNGLVGRDSDETGTDEAASFESTEATMSGDGSTIVMVEPSS